MFEAQRGEPHTWRLVPWHHLASALVPVLAMGATLFMGWNASPPTTVDPLDGMEDTGAPQGLALVISEHGYAVAWSEQAGLPGLRERITELRCAKTCDAPSDWDTEALVQYLMEIKSQHPNADTLTVYPSANVPYRALLDTLQAARSDHSGAPLFPFAVVSSESR